MMNASLTNPARPDSFRKTVVTRNTIVKAKIKLGPKPANLLQTCPAGSWGVDKLYGEKWVCFRGRVVDPDLNKLLPHIEADLRDAGLISPGKDLGDNFIQGAYHGGFGASGTTHDRGGVIDLSPAFGGTSGLTILRRWGLAAWHRPAGSVSSIDHVHAVVIGSKRLTAAAAQQVRDYRAGLNGLANHGPDPGPRPKPIRTWREALKHGVAKTAVSL